MKCHNCGAEIPENVKFCGTCGAPQQVVRQTKGREVPFGNNDKYIKNLQNRKKKKKIVVPLFITLLAIAIVVGAAIAFKSLIKGIKQEANGKYITYYKDRQILQKKSKKIEEEAFVLSDFASHSADDITNPPEGSIQYSADNNYIFYPEEYTYGVDDDPSTFTLMKQKVFSGEPEKVVDSVQSYQLLQDGSIIYQSISSDLYLIKKDEKKKIGSYVYDYKIYEDKGFIAWTVENEEYSGEDVNGEATYDYRYDIYIQALDMKGEKHKLISDADSCSYEKNAVLVLQGGDLYCIDNESDMKQISGDVDGICEMLDDGTIFYEKNTKKEEYMDYLEWVNDPYYDNDMEGEPDYYSDEDNWGDWSAREEVRSAIEDLSPYEMRELYIYRNGKEQLISENFCYDYVSFPNSFFFYVYDMDNFKKVEMDDLVAVDDDSYSSLYYEAMENIEVACCYVDGKIITLQDNLTDIRIDEKNGIGYGIVFNNEDKSYGTLYSFDATKKSDGSLNEIADRASSIIYAGNKKVYYSLNTDDSDYGTMYCNGKQVASDVIYGLGECNDKFYYMIEGSSIESFDGKDTKRIADDVLFQGLDPNNPTKDKGFLILHDYDTRDYTGVLSWCDGLGELTKVDEGVSGFMGQVYLED